MNKLLSLIRSFFGRCTHCGGELEWWDDKTCWCIKCRKVTKLPERK